MRHAWTWCATDHRSGRSRSSARAGARGGRQCPAERQRGAPGRRLSGATQKLQNDGPKPQILIPWSIAASVGTGDLVVRTTSVEVAGVEQNDSWRAFTATTQTLEGGSKGSGSRSTSTGSIGPRAYDVTVSVSATSLPGAHQTIVAHVVLPKATVRPLGPLVFEQTLWPFVSAGPLTPSRVTLRETGGDAALRDIRIEQIGETVHDDRVIPARLVPRPPQTVLHDGSGEVTFDVENTFPPGISHGHFDLDSRSMGDAARVDYEVRARYPSWLIVPLFVISGLLGWTYRVYLRQREERHALEVKASALLERIRAEQIRNPTEEASALSDGGKALATAIASKETGTMGDAMKRADEALEAAVKARVVARTERLRLTASRLAALSAGWRLPTGVDFGAPPGSRVEDPPRAALGRPEVGHRRRGRRHGRGQGRTRRHRPVGRRREGRRGAPGHVGTGIANRYSGGPEAPRRGDVSSFDGCRSSAGRRRSRFSFRSSSPGRMSRCRSVRGWSSGWRGSSLKTVDVLAKGPTDAGFKTKCRTWSDALEGVPPGASAATVRTLDGILLSRSTTRLQSRIPAADVPGTQALMRGDYAEALFAARAQKSAPGIVLAGNADPRPAESRPVNDGPELTTAAATSVPLTPPGRSSSSGRPRTRPVPQQREPCVICSWTAFS